MMLAWAVELVKGSGGWRAWITGMMLHQSSWTRVRHMSRSSALAWTRFAVPLDGKRCEWNSCAGITIGFFLSLFLLEGGCPVYNKLALEVSNNRSYIIMIFMAASVVVFAFRLSFLSCFFACVCPPPHPSGFETGVGSSALTTHAALDMLVALPIDWLVLAARCVSPWSSARNKPLIFYRQISSQSMSDV